MSDEATTMPQPKDEAARFRRRVLILLSSILVVIVAAAITITIIMVTSANDAQRQAELAECDEKFSPSDGLAYFLCIEQAG